MGLATVDEKVLPSAFTLIDETDVTPPRLAVSAFTNAVVAICWLLSVEIAVGAVGVPVKIGFDKVNPETFV